jgi:hypothetical protein
MAEQKLRERSGAVSDRFTKTGAPPERRATRADGAEVREMPEAPRNMWRIVGPGIVGAGVGLASGEFILWPYIASQVGLVFLWGALLGVAIQWFLNTEIERYTLATGETALSGFNRLWRHWGLVFVAMVILANAWPGWATSSATLFTYLFGGPVNAIAIGMLVVIGLALTLAPVVYDVVERTIFLKVAVIGTFLVVAAIAAISGDAWRALPAAAGDVGSFPADLEIAVMLGAIAYAGAGGGQNLCQSNWIRDKGYGMGAYVPRLVSPITGEEEAAHDGRRFTFEPTEENLGRWQRWWRFAQLEQAATFVAITVATIVFMSMLSYSTVFGQDDLPDDIGFLQAEGDRLNELVGSWMGPLFWTIGTFALFAAAMGIVDYTSRLAADLLKTRYLPARSESRLYFGVVWSLIAVGTAILLAGLDQPLVLLVISACTAAVTMFVYSILLLIMNRRCLPEPVRVRSYRAAVLVFAAAFFGVLSAITIVKQVGDLV